MELASVILAAGEGTRMVSDLTKILHPLAGKPIARWMLDTVLELGAGETVFVVGKNSAQIRQILGDHRVRYVYQAERKGTGHAAMQARSALQGRSDLVLVCYGDMPLLEAETLRLLVDNQRAASAVLTILTLIHEDSRGFGRVIRDDAGHVLEVIEEKVCTPEQLAIQELNCGVYCFDGDWLWSHIDQIPLNPVKQEYFLTDMIGIAVADGQTIDPISIDDPDQVIGINTRIHLAQAEAVIRRRVNERLMLAGVTLQDPASTYVEPTVHVGSDTVLLAGTHLSGQTIIGAGCTIGPDAVIRDSTIGDRCRVRASFLQDVALQEGSNVGPFAHLTKEGDEP
ncbi:MAG TPA: NTP transferase domain-containing protein [Anaerolineae bacterium]|nr:NTP transferase domain-containing protein [Anaerolineae bacterium]